MAIDGQGRHAGRPHHLLGADLRAHGLDGLGRGPDPDEPGPGHHPGEVARLGQESVAGWTASAPDRAAASRMSAERR